MADLTMWLLCVFAVCLVHSTVQSPFQPTRQDGCITSIIKTRRESRLEWKGKQRGYVVVYVVKQRTVYRCCEGWSGDNCDLQDNPPEEDPGPCGNRTCLADPQAKCSVIRRCGRDIPVFINATNNIVPTCLTEDLCLGICIPDPCKDEVCERDTKALCYTTKCSCKPIWINPNTMEQVLCTHNETKERH